MLKAMEDGATIDISSFAILSNPELVMDGMMLHPEERVSMYPLAVLLVMICVCFQPAKRYMALPPVLLAAERMEWFWRAAGACSMTKVECQQWMCSHGNTEYRGGCDGCVIRMLSTCQCMHQG